jgi:hypothetical protein
MPLAQTRFAGYDLTMPEWLLPWVVPLAMAAAVILVAMSTMVGVIALVVLTYAVLISLRLRYLKRHPPEPELARKPFWKF